MSLTIFVPRGIQPVHSFDLWGVIIDQGKLGAEQIELYRALAKDKGFDPGAVAKTIANYKRLLVGDPWATGKRKGEIINAIEDPLENYGVKVNYSDFFHEDSILVMRQILCAKEGLIVFTSKEAPWLKEHLPQDISAGIIGIYVGDKSNRRQFERVAAEMASLKGKLITHTADELPELVAARKTGLLRGGLIYVNRNHSNTEKAVYEAGVDVYVNDLREVGYMGFCHS